MKTPWICALFSAALLVPDRLPGAQPAGTVVGWGFDYYGGGTRRSTNVVMIGIQPLTNASFIAAGGNHALALSAEGGVVGWGANTASESIGRRTLENYTSGRVEIGGAPLDGVTALAAGRSIGFSIALRSNGTLVVWGDGSGGQTAPPAGLSNVIAVSAGSLQGLALKADGTVVSWGRGNPPPPGLSNVMAISASGRFGRNLALTRDGRVVDWGAGEATGYDTEVPPGLSNVTAVSAGWNHSLALTQDGTVFGWGGNRAGQATGVATAPPGAGATGKVMVAGQVLSNVVAVSAARDCSLALKSDGTLVSWGDAFGSAPIVPEGLSNVVAISASDYYCLAITTNPAVAARFSRHPTKTRP